MALPPGLVRRVRAASTANEAPLEAGDARQRLARCEGPLELALAFEAALGGLQVGDFHLGLDTHRTHPPRDNYDEWLAPELQRRMVQVAFGGVYQSTYWLDARGWVHEIGPLDRLRPYAEDLASFLEVLLGSREPEVHFGSLLLYPCLAADADAIFGCAPRCPVGNGIARFPPDALEVLEEQAWVERVSQDGGVILSAPRLKDLTEPLATLVQLQEGLSIAILDGGPEPWYDVALAETVACVSYLIPWHEHSSTMQLGRDAEGSWRMVRPR